MSDELSAADKSDVYALRQMTEELLRLRAEVQRLTRQRDDARGCTREDCPCTFGDRHLWHEAYRQKKGEAASSRAALAARLTDDVLNTAMHAHDFARPESSGFDEMRAVLLDALTGAGEETP